MPSCSSHRLMTTNLCSHKIMCSRWWSRNLLTTSSFLWIPTPGYTTGTTWMVVTISKLRHSIPSNKLKLSLKNALLRSSGRSGNVSFYKTLHGTSKKQMSIEEDLFQSNFCIMSAHRIPAMFLSPLFQKLSITKTRSRQRSTFLNSNHRTCNKLKSWSLRGKNHWLQAPKSSFGISTDSSRRTLTLVLKLMRAGSWFSW